MICCDTIPVYIVNNKDVLADNVIILLITTAAALRGPRRVLKEIIKTFKLYVAATIVIIGAL